MIFWVTFAAKLDSALMKVVFTGKKLWGIQRFTTDCTSAARRSTTGTLLDQEEDITDSCLQLMQQLCKDHKSCKVGLYNKHLI